MEKLIYVLWRPAELTADQWSTHLRSLVAAALRQAGAHAVQVNVADADVAEAMVRMSTFDQPIEAVVSLWVDTANDRQRAPIDAVLTRPNSSARSAGYLVTESAPMPPPATGVGARTEGFANVAFLRRPDHLDQDEWLRRWQGQHTEVALTTQSTFGYVQNVVVRAVTPDAPAFDGIVEELFPTEAMTDFHVFFDTGGSGEELHRRMTTMTTSVANFSGDDAPLDVVPTSRYVM